MAKTTARRLAAATCALAIAAPSFAADAPAAPPAKRPRIGLVLGGGGAKGAAHIGVIKVLEELRIPVDCIAGTSMGSIVGAAYATGMSASKLEQIVTAVDWKDILASAPRQEIPVQRKKLDFAFTLGLEVGVRDGDVILPGGLVPTHQIEALFRRILAGAGEVSHFDRLPIPFRAVATDLESGEMKVFDRGDLALAMRASMAVPGAFAPVDTGGRLYVDGMLVRNLPVDVARKTCADVVIAVPVGNPATTRAKLGRLTAVAGQAMNIAVEANEKAQIATLTARDVHIPVVLQNISSADFALVPQAIPIGEAAARQAIESLSRYSMTAPEYARWRAGLREVAELPKVTIDEVRLSGFEVTNPEVMKNFVTVQPGETFDPEHSDADATHLVARGDFTSVSYRLSTEGGRNVLTYDAVEKPWGPNYLLFDFNLSTDLRGDTAWGIRFDYERRWLNPLGGEFRGSLQLGRPNAISGEWYQPLDLAQRYFVAPGAYASQTLEYLYNGDTRAAEVDTRRVGIRLDAGIALGSTGEARIGLMAGRARVDANIGVPLLPQTGESRLGAVTMRLTHDTLDQRLFPSQGQYLLVNGNFSRSGLGADRSYDQATLAVSTVHTIGANVWTLAARGGSGFGDSVPSYDQFRTGGLFNFSGYQTNQLIGQSYAWTGLQYRRRIGYLFETLGTAAWGGVTLEAGNVFDRLDGVPTHGALIGGSMFIGVNSKLGPVFMGYGLSEGGHRALYLYIGSSLELF